MQQQPSTMRTLVRLAIPVAVSQVSDMVTVMADTMMVGRVGTVDLAAATLANSVWVVAALFHLGFMVAITPMAGMAWGAGDVTGVARSMRAGTMVSVIVGAVMVAVLTVLAPQLHVFGAPADVTRLAAPYFMWIVVSMLPRIGIVVLKQTAEAMSNTHIALAIAIVANAANIALNWVFIYGNLGAPAMGLEGAGVATLLSRVIGLGCVLAVFRYSRFFAEVRSAMRDVRSRVTSADLRAMAVTGLPIAGQLIMEAFGFATGAIMIGWMGTVPLAAHQIALNLASLTFMVSLGIASASTILISNAVGRKDHAAVRSAGNAAILATLIWNTITAAIFVVFRTQLATMYTTDTAVTMLASDLLLWAALFQLFDGGQTVGLGMLRGLNDVRIPTIIAAASYAAIGVPLGYALSFSLGLGPAGVWIGYLVALVVASVMYVTRFRAIRPKG
jgi:MATE family multidrug resistance protein